MKWIVEVRGPEVTPGGGPTADEKYGEGQWGPAIFGTCNRDGLSDEDASSFETRDAAYAFYLTAVITFSTSLEIRMREMP